MNSNYKVFTINPGSTSTKIALFDNERVLFKENVAHDAKVLEQYKDIGEQLAYRRDTIEALLEERGIDLRGCDAFVGRGGGLLPVEGGTYEISARLLEDARVGANGVSHPAQLGSQIAWEFIERYGGRGFVVNPPDVDEYEAVARVTGLKEITRNSHIHALNQKETAIRHTEAYGKKYTDCNYIVCHIGGGISVAAHRKGRMIDGTDIVEGEGPMAPTRAGALPAVPLVRLCFSGKYTEKEILGKCMKNGGFIDHLGTSDAIKVHQMASEGNESAALVWEAMIYQICKAIGAMASVLMGKVDGILLGGGMVHNEELLRKITEVNSYIAKVYAYPGEFEMEAMASGAIRVLSGEEEAKTY